jgi:hypothetical protein
MSLELRKSAGYAYSDMSDEEKDAIQEAVDRIDTLEDFYREATQLTTYVEGLEAEFLLRGVLDPQLLDRMREMGDAARQVRNTLAEGIDDYRASLSQVPRVKGYVGTYVQTMKQSRTGDVDAINELNTMRDDLGRIDPNPAPDDATQIESPATVAALFRGSDTAEQRQSVASMHPRLSHAFALEESIAKLARERLAPTAYNAFMARTRENIANDLDAGRPLPPLSNVEALAARNS